MPSIERRAQHFLLSALGALLLAFLLLPLVSLVWTGSAATLVHALGTPAVTRAAGLSLSTSSVSMLVAVTLGTPLAWHLSQSRTRRARLMEGLSQLPIVIPPAVAGLALLLTFGRQGWVTRLFAPHAPALSFSSAAVVAAQVFVSAPLYVQAAIQAFRRVDPDLVLVARTLGATPLQIFARVALPLSRHALLAGAAMAWARALGEFGATLMFAGNLEGTSQTLPLAIYTALERDTQTAHALAVLLMAFALAFLLIARAVSRDEVRAT